MTYSLPSSLQKLIEQLAGLPGIGPKSAYRLALYLLKAPQTLTDNITLSLAEIKQKIKTCSSCNNFTEEAICAICEDNTREAEELMIVETALDLIAFEKTNDYSGLYHVLGGVVSPVQGIGPEDLFLQNLLGRIKENKIKELIIATNPTLEGEATSMYIFNLVKTNFPTLAITRIARGLPTGAQLDYADAATISRSLSGRTTL